MFQKLINYIVLPAEITDFEHQYLERVNRIAGWFFVLHLPLLVTIAALNQTGPLLALGLTSAVLLGPYLAITRLPSKRGVSMVMGVTAMFMGGLLVHFGQGPVQIEMHFYFFVLLALLAVFANPMVIIAAALTAAVHHAVFWLILPASVFNYEAPFWVVAVHAAFVVLESVAACFIARSFFDNVVGLEKIVAERTTEIEARNREIQRLLDTVNQGFLTIDRQGVIGQQRSAAVTTLLGEFPAGSTLVDVVRPLAPKAANWLALGLADVFDSILPVEVTIDQLPKSIRLSDRTLAFEFQPIFQGEELSLLLCVVSDISAQVERENLEAENREMIAIVNHIAQDKEGFLEFFKEAESIIAQLHREHRQDLATVKRLVHTLKGNCAIFGLSRVAVACHHLEDYIGEQQHMPDDTMWTAMFGAWSSAKGCIRRLTEGESRGILIKDCEYERTLVDLIEQVSHRELIQRMATWQMEPTQLRLSRVAEHARSLAQRLGKGEIEVQQVGGHLRTDGAHWSEFWSAFVHVVRNAIDHGLEPSEERVALGKPERGQLTVRTEVRGNQFVIALADDGRGIDWDQIAESARRKGLPHDTEEDLIEALFCDGLSTAQQVTDVSGRGVGLAAVRAVCQRHGGQIAVETSRGLGTTFEFRFPVAQMTPITAEWLRRHGIDNVVWPTAATAVFVNPGSATAHPI